jgi:hypothetical protein
MSDSLAGPSPEEAYTNALREYAITAEFCAGCGDRAEHIEEKAWKKLTIAFDALPSLQGRKLPPRSKITDDGAAGFTTGYFIGLRMGR